MTIINFKKVQHPDPIINRLQANIEDSLRQFGTGKVIDQSQPNPSAKVGASIGGGVLIKSVKLKSGQINAIPHGLGHEATWLVGSLSTPARIYDAANNPLPQQQLYLATDADVTASFWVL